MGEVLTRWVSADSFVDIAEARSAAYQDAGAIMEERRGNLRAGNYEAVPLGIDVLTTASRVLEAETRYGKDSAEYKRAKHSLDVDCQRFVAEGWRNNTWEYFPELEQPYDESIDDFTYMDRSLTEMTRDGITPIADAEEGENRKSEYVEQRTSLAVRSLGATMLSTELHGMDIRAKDGVHKRGLSMATISECPDWAHEAYQAGKKELGGYVPQINKLMVRNMRIETNSRFLEQIGLSGEYITHDVVLEAKRRLGSILPGQQLTKTEVRATQILNMNGEGVLSLTRALDAVASEMSGKVIFLGEEVHPDHPRDYAAVPQEATRRQEELSQEADRLADYLLSLCRGNASRYTAEDQVRAFVDEMFLEKVKHNPVQASITFDHKTARGIIEVMNTEDKQLADRLWLKIKAEAPSFNFCGAGSCGLEGVDPRSKEGQTATALGLKANNSKELLKDKERSCPGCNKKTVYYDLVGNKACIGCKKTKLK
jgi:hypothetical protein